VPACTADGVQVEDEKDHDKSKNVENEAERNK
jgi:hypothetical protein